MDRECEDRLVGGEDGGVAVAMVVVEVDDQHPIRAPFAFEAPDRDRHVGDGAEPFCLVGLGVVVAAAQIEADAAVAGRRQCGGECAAGRVQERHEQLLVPWMLGIEEEQPRQGRRRVQLLHVLGRVHEQQVGVVERRGGEEFVRSRRPARHQRVADALRPLDIEGLAHTALDHVIDVLRPIEEPRPDRRRSARVALSLGRRHHGL